MKGDKKAELWAGVRNEVNGARVLWRGRIHMRQVWGQLGIRGNCLAHPSSKFKGRKSLGPKSGIREEWKMLRPRDAPGRRQYCSSKELGRGS